MFAHLRALLWRLTSLSFKRGRSASAKVDPAKRSHASHIGAEGERAAARFLEQRGLAILARNWRNPADRREELDLVCAEGDTVVFVEVRTRSARALVPGYYTIRKDKKQTLRSAALAYLRRLRPVPATFRFDVVEIGNRPGQPPEIWHFENVPLFAKHDRP